VGKVHAEGWSDDQSDESYLSSPRRPSAGRRRRWITTRLRHHGRTRMPRPCGSVPCPLTTKHLANDLRPVQCPRILPPIKGNTITTLLSRTPRSSVQIYTLALIPYNPVAWGLALLRLYQLDPVRFPRIAQHTGTPHPCAQHLLQAQRHCETLSGHAPV